MLNNVLMNMLNLKIYQIMYVMMNVNIIYIMDINIVIHNVMEIIHINLLIQQKIEVNV